MLQNRNPPRFPDAPAQYNQGYMSGMLNLLRQFLDQINAIQVISIAGINININALPTEAALATLHSGDVYRDTTAGNVLKIKP